MEIEESQEGLKRLDSMHLNQLTSKAFQQKEKEIKEDDDSSEGPSPIKKFGQLKLQEIEELDSFCTDSSYQPSPDFFGNSATKLDKDKFLDVLKIPEEAIEYGPGEGSPLKKELLKPELSIK